MMQGSKSVSSNRLSRSIRYVVVAIALLLGVYMILLVFVKPRPLCPPDSGMTENEKICLKHVAEIIPALKAYKARHGTFPPVLDKLYMEGLVKPSVLLCPDDPNLRNYQGNIENLKSLPFPSSYYYQYTRGSEPQALKVGGVKIPPSSPFDELYEKRGDAYPILCCGFHSTPEQKRINCPRVWLVGRLNGTTERVFRSVRDTTEL